MKPLPACLPCILHQALQVAREASEDEWSQRKVLNEVLRTLPDAEWHQSSPAEILGDAISSARETLKVKQPFAERRAQVQEQFKPLAESFRERVASAGDDAFALAVTGAAAANLVDEMVFSRFARQDLRALFEAAVDTGFERGDPKQLRESLDGAQSVLYLLDNAGEVFFDAILIDQIRALGKTVRVVVRGGGLLHDATEGDVRGAGLAPERREAEAEPEAKSDSEPDAEQERKIPDLIELPHGQLHLPSMARSTDLGAAYEDSQLVIAKGAANYETFTGSDRSVVNLLRAKCEPVAKSLGVQVGGLVLLLTSPSV